MEVTKVRKACFFLSGGSSLMGDRDTQCVNKMDLLCESPPRMSCDYCWIIVDQTVPDGQIFFSCK